MAIISTHLDDLLLDFANCCKELPSTNALFVAEIYRCIRSNNVSEAYYRISNDLKYRLNKSCYSTILAALSIKMLGQLDLESKMPAASKRLDEAAQYERFGEFIDGKLFAIKGDKTACKEIPGVRYFNLYTPTESSLAYFATGDLYPPQHTNKNHIYYECVRINALLKRRKDMLMAQARLNKIDTIEAYYPKYSWITSSDVISVPLNPPTVVSASDKTNLLFDIEMCELDTASRKITTMIEGYKHDL